MTEPSAAFLSVCLPEVVLGVCLIEEGTRKGRRVPGGGRVLWEAISLPGTPLMEALEGDSTRVLPSTALGCGCSVEQTQAYYRCGRAGLVG